MSYTIYRWTVVSLLILYFLLLPLITRPGRSDEPRRVPAGWLRLQVIIERQKFGGRMGRRLTFLNAIAMYRSIQTHCDVLAVAGRLSKRLRHFFGFRRVSGLRPWVEHRFCLRSLFAEIGAD